MQQNMQYEQDNLNDNIFIQNPKHNRNLIISKRLDAKATHSTSHIQLPYFQVK